MNFKDSNEQCYFTCVYHRHSSYLNALFFTRQFYSNSKYFNSYFHNTTNKWVNNINIENNTNILFGEKINLIDFQ